MTAQTGMSVPLILPEVQAAIIAGGHSRRMGQPKLFLDYRGNTFIAHLLAQLQQQVNNVTVVARAADCAQLQDLPAALLTDDEPDQGPLRGIATALRHCQRPWLLITPCDNPLLPPDYATRLLHTARASGSPLVFVRKDGRDQPLYALLRRELLPSLQAYLASGERKVLPWYVSQNAVALDRDDSGTAFTNINTPDEYARFLRAAGG